MKRFLRNVVDGTIYDWNERLAANPKCVEVTYEEAYPERFGVDYNKITRVYPKHINQDNEVINVTPVTEVTMSDRNNDNVLAEAFEHNTDVLERPRRGRPRKMSEG